MNETISNFPENENFHSTSTMLTKEQRLPNLAEQPLFLI